MQVAVPPRRRRIRPDSVLQGTGCVVMGATVLLALRFITLELEGPARILVGCCACFAPCCLCCGSLMLWYGCGYGGGLIGSISGRFRCDLVTANDDLEQARRE
jgi:hypothetical protein